jgi:hypothetical protein
MLNYRHILPNCIKSPQSQHLSRNQYTEPNMKFLILSVIVILHLSSISTRPVEHQRGEDFLTDLYLLAKNDGQINIFSLKTMLLKYVETKYPDMDKTRKSRILKVLAYKIREKILMEIKKKNLRSPWLAKEDMLARMLK